MKMSWLLAAMLVCSCSINSSYGQEAADVTGADSLALRKKSRAATLPLPEEGVFYLRMGKPGGVTVKSTRKTRSGYFPPDSTALPVVPLAAPDTTPITVSIPTPKHEEIHVRAAAPPATQPLVSETVSWQDVRDMERYLLDQLDRRIGEAIDVNQAALNDTEAYLGERMDDRFDALGRRINDLSDDLNRLSDGQQGTVVVAPATSGRALPGEDVSTQPAGAVPPVVPAPVDVNRVPAGPTMIPIVERVEHAILETGVFLALTVNFEFGKDALLPASKPTLDAVGEVLIKYPDLLIEVAGHTDNTGPLQVNIRLSQERADAVRDYLVDSFDALAPERIVAKGYGPSRPIASNDNGTGRMLNRRVEFVVLNPEATEKYTRRPVVEKQSEDELRQMLRQLLEEELQSVNPPGQDSLQ